MKLKITKLHITNFRNINELEINFDNNFTEIYAQNGKGKTNTLSSIMWCLFGKNIYDEKQFPISPIIDGEERNDITTNVKLVINDEYVVSRSYYKRLTTLQTGYIIDGKEQLVAITQTNFNKELAEKYVDETTFKSLSNINYIPNLNWKDLKEMIFSLIGGVSDEEVLLREDFSQIEDYVKKFGVDTTQKVLKDTDSQLNEDIKRLEAEYQVLVNTKEKYVLDASDNTMLQNRKEEIENILKRSEEEEKKKYIAIEEQNKIKNKIEDLKRDIQSLKMQYEMNDSTIKSYQDLYLKNNYDVEMIRQKDINYIQTKIDEKINRRESLDNSNNSYREKLEKIKEKGNELKQKEIKIENDKCSACGQRLPEEIIEKTLNNLKQVQLNELQQLQNEYNNINTIISENSKEIEKINNEIFDLDKMLQDTKVKTYEIVEETERQKEIRVAKEQKELEQVKLNDMIKDREKTLTELEKEYDSMEKISFSEIDNSSLINELNEINTKLATTITLNRIKEDIEKTNLALEEKKNNKLINKNKMQLVAKFNNIKADILREKVRKNFKLVDFKTREINSKGDEEETFKICINGIDYKNLNTGMQILVAIDLIHGIQKLKNIYVPIIIDNMETLSEDIELEDTQLIITRVVRNVERLEVR